MQRVAVAAVALILAAACAVFGWRYLNPREERRIVSRLEALADVANDLSPDASGLAAAARLSSFFTEDVMIDAGGDQRRGRDSILAAATVLPRSGGHEVSIADADVKLSESGDTADVNVTVRVRRNPGSPQEALDAREFALVMRRAGDAWQISRVTAIDTLR